LRARRSRARLPPPPRYEGKVKIGMDVAASEFQTEDKMYDLKFKEKDNDGSGKKTG
jgi:enolase